MQELVAIGKSASLDSGFPNAVIEVVVVVLLSVSVVRYVRGEQHTIVELQELAPYSTLYRYGALQGKGELGCQLRSVKPAAVAQLLHHPHHRLVLLVGTYRLATLALGALLNIREVDAAHIGKCIVEIAAELLRNAVVEFLLVGCRLVVFYPSVKMGKYVLQVLYAIRTSLHGVVAQVFLKGAWVVSCLYLLSAVSVPRIASLRVYPLLEFLCLLLYRQISLDGRVEPLDGEEVVHAHVGWRETHALVFGLSHIVESGIVHD